MQELADAGGGFTSRICPSQLSDKSPLPIREYHGCPSVETCQTYDAVNDSNQIVDPGLKFGADANRFQVRRQKSRIETAGQIGLVEDCDYLFAGQPRQDLGADLLGGLAEVQDQ